MVKRVSSAKTILEENEGEKSSVTVMPIEILEEGEI
jgi:hypothetical protein